MSHAQSVVVTTVVAADPATAFDVFTREVDAWWKQGPKFRPSVRGPGTLRFEPGVGGRLLETYDDESTFEFGRVKVWEPGQQLGLRHDEPEFRSRRVNRGGSPF